MGAPAISSTPGGQFEGPSVEQQRNAVSAARKLNSLNIADREFAVVRDPQSHRFVVVVRDRSTGSVLAQYPPENIVKLAAQLSKGELPESGKISE